MAFFPLLICQTWSKFIIFGLKNVIIVGIDQISLEENSFVIFGLFSA